MFRFASHNRQTLSEDEPIERTNNAILALVLVPALRHLVVDTRMSKIALLQASS